MAAAPSCTWVFLIELRFIKFSLKSINLLGSLLVEDHCPSPDCGAIHPRARRGGRHPPLLCGGDSVNGTASASEGRGWRWARSLLGFFLGGRPPRRRISGGGLTAW